MNIIKLDKPIEFKEYTRKYKIERWNSGRTDVTVASNKTMNLRIYENVSPASQMRFTKVMTLCCENVTFHACKASLSVWMYA